MASDEDKVGEWWREGRGKMLWEWELIKGGDIRMAVL